MSSEATPQEAESAPGVATAESGVVLLDGPDGVAVAMTPEAADATGRSLIAAAEEASAQRGAPYPV
ncbi:hypothetical protein FHS95_000054 [Sphingomonas naasensis]|uniref:Uncharacterized protein n=1 Tax=Sphingomonas naasensis TaxID=1344951 RepID=A0A4S1WQN3_9SPHN|nr:hypothetical protein [Sphingomonas naasensis]NIJ18385.1 hypothetical protein [Sphingomonas naasensis]TGX45654.1 hypothetical protein E5A74_00270 [Sphingomonas naasensis]